MVPSGSRLRPGEHWVRGQGLDSVPLPMGIHVPDAGRLNLGSWDPLQSLQLRVLSGCRGGCEQGGELGGNGCVRETENPRWEEQSSGTE